MQLLLIRKLRDQSVNVDPDREGDIAHPQQVYHVSLWSTDLVEENDVLDEVHVEEGASLLGPSLTQVQEEHGLPAVEVEAEDAVNAVGWLVHKAGNPYLFEVPLEQS